MARRPRELRPQKKKDQKPTRTRLTKEQKRELREHLAIEIGGRCSPPKKIRLNASDKELCELYNNLPKKKRVSIWTNIDGKIERRRGTSYKYFDHVIKKALKTEEFTPEDHEFLDELINKEV